MSDICKRTCNKKDTIELYIGTPNGNIRLCGAEDIGRLEQLIEEIKTRLDAIAPSE